MTLKAGKEVLNETRDAASSVIIASPAEPRCLALIISPSTCRVKCDTIGCSSFDRLSIEDQPTSVGLEVIVNDGERAALTIFRRLRKCIFTDDDHID